MLGATWYCFQGSLVVHQDIDEQAVLRIPASRHPVSVLIHNSPSRSHKDSDKGLAQPYVAKNVIGLLLNVLASHLLTAQKGTQDDTHLHPNTDVTCCKHA